MRVLRIALLAGAALLLASGASRTALRAAPRQVAVGLSPEEAVIAIKPLQLVEADVPQGYALGTVTVSSPVSDAVRQAAAGADPYAALSSLAAEGTQACSIEPLTPPAGPSILPPHDRHC